METIGITYIVCNVRHSTDPFIEIQYTNVRDLPFENDTVLLDAAGALQIEAALLFIVDGFGVTDCSRLV